MSNKQHVQKKNLKVSKGILRKEVDKLRDNWINAGPGVPGVDPEVALDRLRFAKDHLAQCVRKYEMAHNGEELFALPFSEYPELAQTEKDIKLFDQLSDRGVLKGRGAFPALDGLVSIRRGFERIPGEVATRYHDAVRTASSAKKRPPTAIIPGNESPRWRDGAAAPRDSIYHTGFRCIPT